MKFSEYWQEKGHFGGDPQEVAELAWNAAIEACAKIADECFRSGTWPGEIADKIRGRLQ